MRIEKTEIAGLPIIHRVIIEDIIITDEKDIAKCQQYEKDNYHTSVKCVACKYAESSIFIDCVDELVRLEASNKPSNEDKRQSLIRFLDEHFRVTYQIEPTEVQKQALYLYNEYKDRYHYPLVELEKNLILWLKDNNKVKELLNYVKSNI